MKSSDSVPGRLPCPDAATSGQRIWLMNADCELEFERPRNYASDARVLRALEQRRHLFADLTQGESWTFPHEAATKSPSDQPGRQAFCWSPTPAVMALISRKRWRMPRVVPLATLQRVNEKSFISTHLATLAHPERVVVRTLADWQHYRATTEGLVRVRMPFGFAGRGARVVRPLPRADDERFIRDAFKKGYLVAEPELSVNRLWSIHGIRHAEGCLLGEPCRGTVDAHGAPLCVPTRAPVSSRREELREMGQKCAEALGQADYVGPFGLDVIEASGKLHAVDLNARFTLGFSAGLGPEREMALALLASVWWPDGG